MLTTDYHMSTLIDKTMVDAKVIEVEKKTEDILFDINSDAVSPPITSNCHAFSSILVKRTPFQFDAIHNKIDAFFVTEWPYQ